MTAAAPDFTYVQESHSFLRLFPHRYDYIYAGHPQPQQTPNWQTESRYPLADRVLLQGACLFGVRFAAETRYCLLDIDRGSLYHPQRDPFAINRILAALEPVGLVSYLACTSSYRGGIHLYLPFQQLQRSGELAIVISNLLESSGFRIKPGQLEVFPNSRPYVAEGNPSLFNAHRLPLQAGSYLLGNDFQPTWSDRDRFVQHWQFAQAKNELDIKIFKRVLRQSQQKHYRVSGKAEKFISDLNAEIELGWTNAGQTNRLLGRIALRLYVFHHITSGGQPLEGQALAAEIVRTAEALPGYFEWCQHQHEIRQRAEEWSRCVEASRYFHYGSQKGKYKPKTEDVQTDEATSVLSWNQRQQEASRDRIRQAIAQLLDQDSLPAAATARFRLLTQLGVGGASLYRHRDLWHPTNLNPTVEIDLEPVENSSVPTLLDQEKVECAEDQCIEDRAEDKPTVLYLTSLLSTAGSNPLQRLLSRCSDIGICQLTGSNSLQRLKTERLPLAKPLNFATVALEPVFHSKTTDLSDLLAVISVQILRLQWTSAQVNDRLFHHFGKSGRSRLTEAELLQWLEWLEDYP